MDINKLNEVSFEAVADSLKQQVADLSYRVATLQALNSKKDGLIRMLQEKYPELFEDAPKEKERGGGNNGTDNH